MTTPENKDSLTKAAAVLSSLAPDVRDALQALCLLRLAGSSSGRAILRTFAANKTEKNPISPQRA